MLGPNKTIMEMDSTTKDTVYLRKEQSRFTFEVSNSEIPIISTYLLKFSSPISRQSLSTSLNG